MEAKTHVWVPVQLAQPARLEDDEGGGDGLGDGEVARVDLAELAAAAGHGLGRVLEGVIDVRAVADQRAVGPRHVAVADGRVEDVRVALGDGVEDRLGDAEVLREDGLGGVHDPVVEVEGGPIIVSISV